MRAAAECRRPDQKIGWLLRKENRMSINPAAAPAHFNLAVESLKQTLKREKSAAAAISQAIQPPDVSGAKVGIIDGVTESHRGGHINTSA